MHDSRKARKAKPAGAGKVRDEPCRILVLAPTAGTGNEKRRTLRKSIQLAFRFCAENIKKSTVRTSGL